VVVDVDVVVDVNGDGDSSQIVAVHVAVNDHVGSGSAWATAGLTTSWCVRSPSSGFRSPPPLPVRAYLS